MKLWLVKFSSERRDNGLKVEFEDTVKAMSQIEAEDRVMRKRRLLGYRNYCVEAKEIA